MTEHVTTGAWVAVLIAITVPIEAATLAAMGWLLRLMMATLRDIHDRTLSIEDYLWGPKRARPGAAHSPRRRKG